MIISLSSAEFAHRVIKVKLIQNGIAPDQAPQNAVSDQVLHCLPFIQLFLDISTGRNIDLFQFYHRNGKDLKGFWKLCQLPNLCCVRL